MDPIITSTPVISTAAVLSSIGISLILGLVLAGGTRKTRNLRALLSPGGVLVGLALFVSQQWMVLHRAAL